MTPTTGVSISIFCLAQFFCWMSISVAGDGDALPRQMGNEGRNAYGADGIAEEFAENGRVSAGDMQPLFDRHNEYRRKHQAPDLAWSSRLAGYAQEWADYCRFYRSDFGFGENLYDTAPNVTLDVKNATDAWYDEVMYYDFDKPGWSEETKRFTQVVWVSTDWIGCALKGCFGGNLLVCMYFPPGNTVWFEYNVLPPK